MVRVLGGQRGRAEWVFPLHSRYRANERGRGQRGDYVVFIAVIATSLLLLGGLAYDGPRPIAARQDAAHAATTVRECSSTLPKRYMGKWPATGDHPLVASSRLDSPSHG